MSADRREFLTLLGSSAVAACVGRSSAAALDSASQADSVGPLRTPAALGAGELAAMPAEQQVWPGSTTRLLTFGGSYPGPTLRAQAGDRFAVRVVNRLAEPTNVHWHGLVAPAQMDGHPADALSPGAVRDYTFPIAQRAGTYWYHPHVDGTTGRQVYSGMAGFFLVADAEESRLGLPAGEREVALLLQDRRSYRDRSFTYAPGPMDVLSGYLGDAALVNGVPGAALPLAAALYRFRFLNGSNARIFRLGFSDGRVLHVIGTDGGLLDRPMAAASVDLGPGERLDALIDLSDVVPGRSVWLRSLAFAGGGMGMGMGGLATQGAPMELLRLDVDRLGPLTPPLPARLVTLERLDPSRAVATRRFVFEMTMPPFAGGARINGRSFSPSRVDERVRLGDLEVWEFVNASNESHPVHVHAASFQVISRSRGGLGPQDLGWKDTVLTWPGETVRVAIRFSHYPGLYVLHCHNLEHEDAGMMLNVEVE